jgi:hypothetical protein
MYLSPQNESTKGSYQMTKPVGYYTSYTPGESGLLADMQSEWGATFEQLNQAERAWMIYQLGYQLWMEIDEEVRDLVEETINNRASHELSSGDKLGLIEALVNQMKYSN